MRLIKKANLRIKGTGNEFVCPKDVHNELLKYGNVRIDGNNNKINIGGPNYLKFADIKIFGNNNTLILPPGCYGKLNLEIRTSDAVVTVGHKTGFMGTDIILEEKGSRVIIGDDCMFAKETRLYCSDFHAVIDLKTGRPCNQGKEIVIGNHVWLGEGVKILKNCHVTDNVIIGIGLVVTKDLTTGYAMYAGNPAVCKKTDINWVPEAYDLAMAQLESQQE